MQVRPATAADLSAMLHIEAAAGREPWTEGAVLGVLDHGCGQGLVVTEHGEVRGHVLCMVVADEAEILTIAVDPAHQRRGIAGHLLRSVMQRWRDDGVVRVVLEVRIGNAPARALYARAGFAKVGERSGYYADGEDAAILAAELANALSPCGTAPSS